jgi:hypothetical protein
MGCAMQAPPYRTEDGGGVLRRCLVEVGDTRRRKVEVGCSRRWFRAPPAKEKEGRC